MAARGGPALEAAARAVRHGWPCLVYGSGAAAAAVPEALAAAAGAMLWRVQCSPATDVADLVGGYEQVDAARRAPVPSTAEKSARVG